MKSFLSLSLFRCQGGLGGSSFSTFVERRRCGNPRSGAASIDRSDQTALQGTAPQPNKSRLQADSERLYIARDGSERDEAVAGRHAHATARLSVSLFLVGLLVSTPPAEGDGAPSRPSKARGANVFASSRRDSNLEAFSRYPADVAAHHWPLGQVRAPEVRYCGSSRTEQGCYRENQSSGG